MLKSKSRQEQRTWIRRRLPELAKAVLEQASRSTVALSRRISAKLQIFYKQKRGETDKTPVPQFLHIHNEGCSGCQTHITTLTALPHPILLSFPSGYLTKLNTSYFHQLLKLAFLPGSQTSFLSPDPAFLDICYTVRAHPVCSRGVQARAQGDQGHILPGSFA